MSDFMGMTGFGTQSAYSSGAADGNTGGGGAGAPNVGHSATIVAIIIIAALVLLVAGVIGLRASGEVVI